MFCFSGNFALQPDLLACFSSVTLLFGQSWCSKVSIRQWECFTVPAMLGFSLEYIKWLSSLAGCLEWPLPHHHPTQRSEIRVHASCTDSICVVFVCDAELCFIKTKNMTLCVFMTFSEPGRLRPMTMLLGSGAGVLPFTVNPVTPTGSTNCDTGTVSLHCFPLICFTVWFSLTKDTLSCLNAWYTLYLCSFYLWFFFYFI